MSRDAEQRDVAPQVSYFLARWVFLRVLGLCFVFAHLSLAQQIVGLVGEDGIQPAAESLRVLREDYGAWAPLRVPSLYWWSARDHVLQSASWLGVGASALLVLNVWPRLTLAIAWFVYLSAASLYHPRFGGFFFDYPPDHVLLEAGAIAIFLAPRGRLPGLGRASAPAAWARLLLAALLFKLMFGSGATKLVNGGATWFDGSALLHDCVTRPSPTPLALRTMDAPGWLLALSTIFVVLVEVVAPFFFFARGRARRVAALLTLTLMGGIMLTGNYRWFPLATCGLALLLIDDRAWGAGLARFAQREVEEIRPSRVARAASLGATFIATPCLLALGAAQTLDSCFPDGRAPRVLDEARVAVRRYRLSHGFRLFGRIARAREVLVFEGSADGERWLEFDYHLNPGDPRRPLSFVAPYHYYFDFLVWFAGGAVCEEHATWLRAVMQGLLSGNAASFELFASSPFGADCPPRYVRVFRYHYRFASVAERARGACWEREALGAWTPTVTLRDGELAVVHD